MQRTPRRAAVQKKKGAAGRNRRGVEANIPASPPDGQARHELQGLKEAPDKPKEAPEELPEELLEEEQGGLGAGKKEEEEEEEEKEEEETEVGTEGGHVVRGASLILFSLTEDVYNIPCVMLAREKRQGWTKRSGSMYTDFGGGLCAEDGDSAEALAAREFVEETLGAVQYFAGRDYAGETRDGAAALRQAVQSSLEEGHYLAKMQFRLKDGATYVTFLKQVPWQPGVSCKFKRARALLDRTVAARRGGGVLSTEDRARLSDHPAAVFSDVPDERQERTVTILPEYLEKTNIEYFSLATLAYFVDTGATHLRAPLQCLRYFKGRLRAAVRAMQRCLLCADMLRSPQPTLAYILPPTPSRIFDHGIGAGGDAAPAALEIPAVPRPPTEQVPRAVVDSQLFQALTPRTGSLGRRLAARASRAVAPAAAEGGRSTNSTLRVADLWRRGHVTPHATVGAPRPYRPPPEDRFGSGPLRNVIERVLIDNKQRWRASADELRTRCSASDNSIVWAGARSVTGGLRAKPIGFVAQGRAPERAQYCDTLSGTWRHVTANAGARATAGTGAGAGAGAAFPPVATRPLMDFCGHPTERRPTCMCAADAAPNAASSAAPNTASSAAPNTASNTASSMQAATVTKHTRCARCTRCIPTDGHDLESLVVARVCTVCRRRKPGSASGSLAGGLVSSLGGGGAKAALWVPDWRRDK